MRLSKNLLVTAAVAGIILIGNPNVDAKPLTAKISMNYQQIDKLLEYDRFQEADRILNNMLNANSNNITARSLYVISLAKQGKLDVAQSQIDALMPKYRNNANLHYAQGIVNVKRQASSDMDYRNNSQDLIKDAITEFQTAIKLNSKYYPAYNALGVIALNTGNKEKAKEFFNKALDIMPNYATAIDNLGSIDYLNGNYDGAQKRFLKTISINPNSSTGYFHLAQVYDKKSLYSKGLDALDHSLRLKPDSSVAYNLRGEILKKQGNETAAIESFKKAISVRPENTKPYMNLAKIYEKRFDNELAIANLKSALAVNPNLNQAKLYVGDLALLKGDNKEALKYYSSLVGVQGYNADALRGMANAYFAQAKESTNESFIGRDKDLQTAYDNIEKAIKANPNDMQLYLAKLKIAKLTNKPKETEETLQRIIDAPIKGLNDLLTKGDAYFAMNMYEEAKDSFENAVIFAQTPEDYLFVAEILTYDRFYPSAKNLLRKVLILDPSNDEAMHNLEYIMSMEKQSESLYKDAKFFSKQNKNKVFAREYALKSLEFNPTNYQAAKLTAKLCEKQKHYEDAIDAYKIVAGLEKKPRKVARINKKITKLEKKVNRYNTKYMKSEDKKFKKWQKQSVENL